MAFSFLSSYFSRPKKKKSKPYVPMDENRTTKPKTPSISYPKIPSTSAGGRNYAYSSGRSSSSYITPKAPSSSAGGRQYAQSQVSAGKATPSFTPKPTTGGGSSGSSGPKYGNTYLGGGSMGDLVKSIKPTVTYDTKRSFYEQNNLPIPKATSFDKVENQRLANQISFNNRSSSSGGSSKSSSNSISGGGGSSTKTTITPTINYGDATQQMQSIEQPQSFQPEYQTVEQQVQQPIQQQIDFTPYYSQIDQLWSTVNDQGKALIAQLSSDFLQELNSMQSQIENQFQNMLGGVDPATQQALTQLQQDVESRQRSILEYLNARGVAQSGRTIEEFGKLAGTANDQQTTLMANNLRELQNQMLSQMWNFAQSRINAMSQFGQNAMNQFNQYAQGVQSNLKNSMNTATEAFAQQQQNQREQMQQQNQNYRAELPYRYPSANELVPYQYGPTPYQQGQLNIGQQNAATSAQNAQNAAGRLALEQQQYTQNQQNKQTSTQIQSKAFGYPPEQAIQFVQQNAQNIIAEVGTDEYAKILRNVQEYAYN